MTVSSEQGRGGGGGSSAGSSGAGRSGGGSTGGPQCFWESGPGVDVVEGPLELGPSSHGNWLYELAPEGQVWSIAHCLHADGRWVNRAALMDADPEAPAVASPPPVVTPADLALRATAKLRFDFPGLGVSPPNGQLVGFPMWVWVDPASWTAQSATDVDGGLSVTLTATPMTVLVDPGDGSAKIDCGGPGTRYEPGRHGGWDASPTCGHTYTDVPAGGTVDLRVEVVWRFGWVASDGRQGTLPDLTVAHTEPIVVRAYTAVTD